MEKFPDFRALAYLFVTAGCVLTAASAVVPFYDAGYRLAFGVLLVGLIPYLAYAALSDIVRGWPLLIAGALVLGIDLGVRIPERFIHYDGYASGAVYYAPLFSTLVVIPVILGIGARRQRDRGAARRTRPAPPATGDSA
ncbi:MAG TPA: hypothetical protein VGA00_13615 [Acidiferrobacterales bacterium]|jgi:hypothetical protein